MTAPPRGYYTPNASPAEVAARALEILEERGWGQGSKLTVTAGPVCIGQALGMVCGPLTPTPFLEAKRAAGLDHPDDRIYELVLWNDEPERTYEDVVLVLKKMVAGECSA